MQRLYASIERFTNTGRRRRGADPTGREHGVAPHQRARPPSWYVHHGPAPPVQIELLARLEVRVDRCVMHAAVVGLARRRRCRSINRHGARGDLRYEHTPSYR